MSLNIGSSAQFKAGDVGCIRVAKIDTDKFVVVWFDTLGRTRIGQASGTTLSYGTTSDFILAPDPMNYVGGDYPYTPFDVCSPNTNIFVIAYAKVNVGSDSTLSIATVSGNTITWGDSYAWNGTGGVEGVSLATIEANKFVVAFNHIEATDDIKVQCVSNFGGFLNSAGATVTIDTNGSEDCYTRTEKLAENKFITAYVDSSGDGYVIVGTTPSGTAAAGHVITLGTKATFGSSIEHYVHSICRVDDDKFVICYQRSGNHYMRAGTVSGTTVTLGSETAALSNVVDDVSTALVGVNATDFVLIYKYLSNSWGITKECSVNWGTLAITQGDETAFSSAASFGSGVERIGVEADLISAGKLFIGWREETPEGKGVIAAGALPTTSTSTSTSSSSSSSSTVSTVSTISSSSSTNSTASTSSSSSSTLSSTSSSSSTLSSTSTVSTTSSTMSSTSTCSSVSTTSSSASSTSTCSSVSTTSSSASSTSTQSTVSTISTTSSTTTSATWPPFVFIDELELPDLLFENEFGKELIHVETEKTLDGRPVIWEQAIASGKEIDLVSGNDYGWVTRAQLLELQALAKVPNAVYTLRFGTNRVWTVRFRLEDPPVISATPVVSRYGHIDSDYYNNVRIKLMEI